MPTEKDDLLNLLKEDTPRFNQYRRENPRESVDFSGIILRGARLRGANLGGILLQKADLREADLVEASLGGADLREADLRGANLIETTLHRANMRGADVRGAKLGGFTGEARMCVNACCFEDVRYDKDQLEQILEVLNMNKDWVIKYEIEPRNS